MTTLSPEAGHERTGYQHSAVDSFVHFATYSVHFNLEEGFLIGPLDYIIKCNGDREEMDVSWVGVCLSAHPPSPLPCPHQNRAAARESKATMPI